MCGLGRLIRVPSAVVAVLIGARTAAASTTVPELDVTFVTGSIVVSVSWVLLKKLAYNGWVVLQLPATLAFTAASSERSEPCE